MHRKHPFEPFHCFKLFNAALNILYTLIKLGNSRRLRQSSRCTVFQDAHVDSFGGARAHITNDTLAILHTVVIGH